MGDNRSRELRKFRLIPLLLPALIALALFFIWRAPAGSAGTAGKVMTSVLFLPVALTSYYNFKHLILPDVEFGILRAMRVYNAFVILLTVLCVLSTLCGAYGLTLPAALCELLSGGTAAAVIVAARRGVRKWFQ